MNSKSFQNIKINNDFFELLNFIDDCKASKASTEIMIDRFYCEADIDYPLSQ